MNAHKTSLSPGDLIDNKYRLDRLIGKGGMGAVFEATHIIRGKVAIKCLHSRYATDDKAKKRFHREALVASSIGHDNICETEDMGTTRDGYPYLVMPLLKGCSLAQLIRQPERLPLNRVKDIYMQVLCALESVHNINIVHRDLKPDNVFITRGDDRDDFVKVLDFGVSKVLDHEMTKKLTASGVVMGTPHYMAPEQAQALDTMDHRADLYTVGVMLYETITGRRPFEGKTYNRVMLNIVTAPFPAPKSLNPSIPEALDGFVLKAISRNPNERFENARIMREALARIEIDLTAQRETLVTKIDTVIGSDGPFVTAKNINLPVSSPSPVDAKTGDGYLSWIARHKKSVMLGAIITICGLALCLCALTHLLQFDGRIGLRNRMISIG